MNCIIAQSYFTPCLSSQDLLQSISDHEPDFTSLKKEAHTLCQGPPNEEKLLTSHSQLRESSATFVSKQLDETATETSKGQGSSPGKPGWTGPRPGQTELESRLADYERRLEELKEKLSVCQREREGQLEKARECQGLLDDLEAWLKEGVAKLDGLRVRDPSCAVIEEQQGKCQVQCTLRMKDTVEKPLYKGHTLKSLLYTSAF